MLPRERFAWVWLTALVVVFGVYFTAITVAREAWLAQGFLQKIIWLAIALGSLGIVALVAWLATRGRVALDERDRVIELRACAMGYYVLMAGMIVVGCYLPFVAGSSWDIVHPALLAIAIAEIVSTGLKVLWYRRGGWHG